MLPQINAVLSTFWTQLTYHFNRRTVEPLVFPTLPGGDEPTSFVIIKALYPLLQIVSYLLRLCHQLTFFNKYKLSGARGWLISWISSSSSRWTFMLTILFIQHTSLQISIYLTILSLLAIHPIFYLFSQKEATFIIAIGFYLKFFNNYKLDYM